jgi:hypothetical protein
MASASQQHPAQPPSTPQGKDHVEEWIWTSASKIASVPKSHSHLNTAQLGSSAMLTSLGKVKGHP